MSAIESALLAIPDEELPASVREIHDGMRLCSSFMVRTVNNLCDVRQLEEGKMEFHNCPLELDNLLAKTQAMLASSVKQGVEFKYTADVCGKNVVMGDFYRIQQVCLLVLSVQSLRFLLSSTSLRFAITVTSGVDQYYKQRHQVLLHWLDNVIRSLG